MSLLKSRLLNALPYLGIGFTVLVVGLLGYLHIVAHAVTPQDDAWIMEPRVYVCSDAPLWVDSEAVSHAADFWRQNGDEIMTVRNGRIDCSRLCDLGSAGQVKCSDRAILISGATARLDPRHAGLSTRASESGVIQWATIEVPSVYQTDDVDDDFLPVDFYQLLLTHELGHALGYGHTYTPAGPLRAHKSGHIMHPETTEVGWDTEGIR